ncbi:MAG: VWA domain-containing protein [Aeromicrobium sp.]|uniref:vWA domain-containing protein n=1 Tax=Aeromicrobium sp. TaxID=1871063 RepID=UPI0039E68883
MALKSPVIAAIVWCLSLGLAACDNDDTTQAAAEDPADEPPAVPTVIVLDASASMLTDDAPGVRFEAAQEAIGSLVEALPESHELGLVVFGNGTGSTEAEQSAGCQDVSTLIELGPLDRDEFVAEVDSVQPSGFTPIAASLGQAAELLPDEGERAIVIVSDGQDMCGELGLGDDPCEVAEALDGVTVHTVGFKTEAHAAAAEQLSCVAESTGGLFLDAANPGQLEARLPAVLNPEWARSTIQPAGYHGLTPGMTVDEAVLSAEAAGEELPEVAATGRVEVVYVDCTLVFEDGVLAQVVSESDDLQTIDGIGVGDDIAKAEELYNLDDLPSAPTDEGTVVYPADLVRGTGYEFSFEPADGGSDTVSGTITKIILCACLPEKRWSDDPSDWKIGPGYYGPLEVGMPMTEIEEQGFAQKIPDPTCSDTWERTDKMPDFAFLRDDWYGQVGPDGRMLAGVGVSSHDWETNKDFPPEDLPKSAEGAGVGTSVEELRRIYGERLHYEEWFVEGGRNLGYVVYGEKGALIFNIGSEYQSYDTVQGLEVVAGTSGDDLIPIMYGC